MKPIGDIVPCVARAHIARTRIGRTRIGRTCITRAMPLATIAIVLCAFFTPAIAEPDRPFVESNPYARGSNDKADAKGGAQTKPVKKATKPAKPGDRRPNPYDLENPFDDDLRRLSTDDGVVDPFADRAGRGRVTGRGRGATGLTTIDGSPIEASLVDDPLGGGSSGGASGGGASGASGGGASDPLGSGSIGSSGSGSTGSGSTGSGATGSGSTGPGSTGSGSTGPGSTGPGATGSGSTGPGATGSDSTGSGSAGSGSTGSGSTGSGSSGSGAGSGSAGSGSPTIIQLPTDVAAPEVNASAFPTAVRLGGRFTLIVTATFGAGVEVNLKEPFDLGPAFEVRRRVSEDRPRGDGKTTREWQIDVLAWELGDLRVSGITVTYTVNGAVGQVDTNAIRLRVDGVLGDQVDDPKALRDLQPPTELITDNYFWLMIAGGVLWVVAIIVLAWYLAGRRRARILVLTGGVVARPRKMDMTSEKALAALLAIEKSGVLADNEQRREGYAKMVDVIREYLGARYRVATLDLTSSELVRRLANVAPEEERGLVEEWLATCDLVKYGGLRTTTDEAKAVLDDARALVVTTSQPRLANDARTEAAA